MEWIDINKTAPDNGRLIRAFGTWYGEICGEDQMDSAEGKYIAVSNSIDLNSDTYQTSILNITHWHPLIDRPDAII